MDTNRASFQIGPVFRTIAVSLFLAGAVSSAEEEYTSPRSKEACLAYRASPFSELSMDYFARFRRDPRVTPSEDEMEIGENWRVLLSTDAKPLTEIMANHLREFLNEQMGLRVSIERQASECLSRHIDETIVLRESEADDSATPQGSFGITAESRRVLIEGKGPTGLRNGVVKLVNLVGLARAPILRLSKQSYEPRVPLRVGKVPWMGSYRDLVFMGYNGAVLCGDADKGSFRPITGETFSLYALSTSDAIPELKTLRNSEAVARLKRYAEGAHKYELKLYIWLNMRPVFAPDHPVFKAHPDTRGALMYDDKTWYKEKGKHVLCTESPLVRRYISETIRGIFKDLPGLSGIGVIIGGEEFHHCFMRPYGVERGHTNCPRCERLGHNTVVANLCNTMATAARKVNPAAEIFAWPYSAVYVWSVGDPAQKGLIDRLKPGVALFSDLVKDETVIKSGGIKKLLWDYSIDLAGPGKIAQQRLEACRARGVPIHFKSEPELSFEASRLPGLPCMDRWVERANAMAACGVDGSWVFPWFVPCLGAGTTEVFSHFWWRPAPEPEDFLQRFADRIAGPEAGPHLRNAWRHASQAMDYSPRIGPYFRGVYYLGPAHPMCADPTAKLPEQFKNAGGASFVLPPTGNIPVFAKSYRQMADCLALAAKEIDLADKVAPKTSRVFFDAEASNLRWFYHTVRSTANYYESCRLRDKLLDLVKEPDRSPPAVAEAERLCARWREVLLDERENTVDALPVMAADMRLDFYYGFGGVIAPSRFHGVDMMRKKLEILQGEIDAFLPSLAKRLGVVQTKDFTKTE